MIQILKELGVGLLVLSVIALLFGLIIGLINLIGLWTLVVPGLFVAWTMGLNILDMRK